MSKVLSPQLNSTNYLPGIILLYWLWYFYLGGGELAMRSRFSKRAVYNNSNLSSTSKRVPAAHSNSKYPKKNWDVFSDKQKLPQKYLTNDLQCLSHTWASPCYCHEDSSYTRLLQTFLWERPCWGQIPGAVSSKSCVMQAGPGPGPGPYRR